MYEPNQRIFLYLRGQNPEGSPASIKSSAQLNCYGSLSRLGRYKPRPTSLLITLFSCN